MRPKIQDFRSSIAEAVTPAPLLMLWRANRYRRLGEPEIRLLPRLARGSLALDIGAAHGVYSYWLSKLYPSVIAFEPDARWASALNRAGIPNLTVRERAVSDKRGRASFFVPLEGGGLSRGLGSLTRNAAEGLGEQKTVTTTTLDSEELPAVGFIKIDIEGHELEALAGAIGVLSRDRPTLQVELDERSRPGCIANGFSFLRDFSYRPHTLVDETLIEISAENALALQNQSLAGEGRPQVNFIFLPRGVEL